MLDLFECIFFLNFIFVGTSDRKWYEHTWQISVTGYVALTRISNFIQI